KASAVADYLLPPPSRLPAAGLASAVMPTLPNAAASDGYGTNTTAWPYCTVSTAACGMASAGTEMRHLARTEAGDVTDSAVAVHPGGSSGVSGTVSEANMNDAVSVKVLPGVTTSRLARTVTAPDGTSARPPRPGTTSITAVPDPSTG